jgi:hypothetical protein
MASRLNTKNAWFARATRTRFPAENVEGKPCGRLGRCIRALAEFRSSLAKGRICSAALSRESDVATVRARFPFKSGDSGVRGPLAWKR